ncbi:type ISP restriction/modification enzyme, partial [Staphylococcus pseudintermedius]
SNVDKLITNFNNEVSNLSHINNKKDKLNLSNRNENYIKWSEKLNGLLCKNEKLKKEGVYVKFMHRPFTKKWIYWDKQLNERPSSYRGIMNDEQKIIYIQGAGSK